MKKILSLVTGAMLASLLLAFVLPVEAFAQKAKTKKKSGAPKEITGSAAEEAFKRKKAGGGGKLQDLVLDKQIIKYRVPAPRIKFSMERKALIVDMDNSKLEGLTEQVNEQPKKILLFNKVTEQPAEMSPQEVVNRPRQ